MLFKESYFLHIVTSVIILAYFVHSSEQGTILHYKQMFVNSFVNVEWANIKYMMEESIVMRLPPIIEMRLRPFPNFYNTEVNSIYNLWVYAININLVCIHMIVVYNYLKCSLIFWVIMRFYLTVIFKGIYYILYFVYYFVKIIYLLIYNIISTIYNVCRS